MRGNMNIVFHPAIALVVKHVFDGVLFVEESCECDEVCDCQDCDGDDPGLDD